MIAVIDHFRGSIYVPESVISGLPECRTKYFLVNEVVFFFWKARCHRSFRASNRPVNSLLH